MFVIGLVVVIIICPLAGASYILGCIEIQNTFANGLSSCLNNICPVAWKTASSEQNTILTILIINRPPINSTGGISAFFLTFWCLQYAYLHHFYGEIIFALKI